MSSPTHLQTVEGHNIIINKVQEKVVTNSTEEIIKEVSGGGRNQVMVLFLESLMWTTGAIHGDTGQKSWLCP